MTRIIFEFLLYLASCCILANSRKLPDISSFEKEISIPKDQSAHRVWPPVTENESFVYAICDAGDPVYFREKHCNVSIETPALSSASFKDTCLVKITGDSVGQETLSNLIVRPFGDERIALAWSQADGIGAPSTAKLRILTMSSCRFIDITLPTDSVPFLVSYGTSMDVGLRNEHYCGSLVCRIRLNATGDIIDGPTEVLNDNDLLFYYALTPVPANSEDKGFYVSLAYAGQQVLHEHLFKINVDGTRTKLMTISPGKYSSYSTSHELLSVCTSVGNTTVSCYQYYSSLNLLTNLTVEFDDEEYPRWFQPHNLREGGLLLATGKASDPEGKRYDSFSLIKLFANGRKGRPLTIDGLNFTCRRIGGLFVVVTENQFEEYCFNFSCSRGDAHKFASKCLSKAHAAMSLARSPAILN